MMKWIYLIASITTEVLGTICLKLASGETEHAGRYVVGVVVFYSLCFGFLGQAMRHFSLSVVYATWSGVGVGLLALIGVVVFGDSINLLKVVSFIMVIAGVVGLNMSGMSH